MNIKEKLAVGMGLILAGIMLMNVSAPSISTVGSMLVGIGLTLFLTNLKE